MWFRFKNDRWRAVAKPWAIAGALIFSLTVGSAPGPAVGALPPVVFGQFEALAILAPSPLVRRIQELLTELGEYDGPADGRMNDDTLAAVKGYQRQSGLDDDGRVTQALIDHIEFTGRAIELGEKVERIRAGQIDVAEQALMTRPETRALLEANFDDERADPTRDVSKCFAAPDARCLLEEALNSAKSVNRDRFRDWVLGEIVVAQAQAGLVAAAMDTAARIGDPRLIIVALGNMASAEAQSGAVDQALAAARVIPDPWARAKALAAVVAAMAAAGNPQAMATAVDEIIGLSRTLPAERGPAQFLAGLATELWRKSGDVSGQVLADASDRIMAEAAARMEPVDVGKFRPGASAVAVALADLGRVTEAVDALETLDADSDRRPVFAALAAAATRQGRFLAGAFYAAEITEARYWVITLAEIGGIQAQAGFDAEAKGTLAQALADAKGIDYQQSFARSHALRAVAITLVAVGSVDRALEATNLIQDPRVMAEALWTVGLARTPGAASENTMARFNILVASFPSALDRTWVLCNAAIRARSQGNSGIAQTLLSRALAEAQSIQDPWARAQALAKAATTLVTLAGAP